MSDNRVTPQLGEYPMTIVAVMKESEDSLLLAADSQFTGYGIRLLRPKLRQVPNQQIAWSCAGNPSIGLDEFGDWLKTYDFVGKDWRLFSEDAIDKLSELNGAQRERTRLSGAEWKEGKFCAEIIIAGWLEGNLGAYVLSDDGRPYDALRYEFETIGTGAGYAHVARSAVKLCAVDLDKLTTLKIVMDAVAGHVDDCFLPIEIWRINKDKIEKILNT